MEYLIGAILAIVHASLAALFHKRKIRKTAEYNREHGTNFNYNSGVGGFIIKVVAASFIGFVMSWIAFPVESYWELLYFILAAIYSMGIYWLWFDAILNFLRGKKLSYVSVTNYKFFDEIFKGSFIKQLSAKVGVICFGIITTILF